MRLLYHCVYYNLKLRSFSGRGESESYQKEETGTKRGQGGGEATQKISGTKERTRGEEREKQKEKGGESREEEGEKGEKASGKGRSTRGEARKRKEETWQKGKR